MQDPDFIADAAGLQRAVGLLASADRSAAANPQDLPAALPAQGIGAHAALEQLAPLVLGGAARLGTPTAFAHMDPPTPWLTWATTMWNASLNQNLLHPATAPAARAIEQRVVDWLAPHFGMGGGHMTTGSTLANLTALWAARECAGIDEVVSSTAAHLSVAKAAHLLGLRHRSVTDLASLDGGGLARSALVITAGTTSSGAIEPLALAGRAAWTHVDAAWAGPLRLSERHAARLDGIERADSVAVSAHKWLFQPKASALVFFREAGRAHAAISFGGAYLAVPNVGVAGSHGAIAVPLLATLLAWGRNGLAARIDRCMALAAQWAGVIAADARLQLHSDPASGVVVWRPVDAAAFDGILAGLPAGSTSTTVLDGERWLRNVAANPDADPATLAAHLARVLDECSSRHCRLDPP